MAHFNSRACRMGETPSAAAQCSARGLAKLAALVLAKGSLDGVTVMKPEMVEKLHAEPKEARDAAMGGMKTNFTQGGIALFK